MPTVRDIMTKPVIVIRSAATVADAIWMMQAQRVRSLIVEKRNASISYGILTERDIVYNVIAVGKRPEFIRVADIMRYPCIHLPSEATMQEAAQLLSDAGIHRAPVIECNQLIGMVSVTDILASLADCLRRDAPPLSLCAAAGESIESPTEKAPCKTA